VSAVQARAVEVIDGLTADEWNAASAAPGWTVHDVAAHMSSSLHELFGSLLVKVATSKDIEALNETPVEARRHWPHAEVAAEYRRWAPRARRALQLTQLPLIGGIRVPMAELGKFPARVLPSAIAFDTHTHLYHDIAPALSRPLPDPAPAVIAATLEWMMLVAANIGADLPLRDGQIIRFSFTGPGGAEWLLRRCGRRVLAELWSGQPALATVTGAAVDFPAWGTHRRPWRECGLDTSGDVELATAILDAVRVV
jgi:uncharacterized protein (TIGR03083 family)